MPTRTKIQHLREHLFETIEKLMDEDQPMPVDRACAIANVATAIINSAKVEMRFLELKGQEAECDFLKAPEVKPALLPMNKKQA